MLVYLDLGPVNLDGPQVESPMRHLEDTLEYTCKVPAPEALIDSPPLAEAIRQVTPRTACPDDVEDAFKTQTVIDPGPSRVSGLAWEQCFDMIPLSIGQSFSNQKEPPFRH